MSPGTVLSRFALPLWAVAVWGCGGDDLVLPTRTEPQIEALHGDEQVAPPGTQVPEPLIVRLVDPSGGGIPGRAVVWVVNAGGGSIEPASDTTDDEGFAFARWTLGPAAGMNSVRAEVPEIGAVTFTAVASTDGGGGPGDAPSADNSTIVAEPASILAVTGTSTITVTVRDQDGDPVSGATVTLQASGSGNTLTQPAVTTGADGVAVGTFQAATAGTREISARVNGFLTLNQTASVTVTSAPSGTVDDVVRLTFLEQPPPNLEENQTFNARVALLDASGNLVAISGVVVYVGLFPEGDEFPSNDLLEGERFVSTVGGVAEFQLRVTEEDRYRLRALTDDLPRFGRGGPQPYLFSQVFDVN